MKIWSCIIRFFIWTAKKTFGIRSNIELTQFWNPEVRDHFITWYFHFPLICSMKKKKIWKPDSIHLHIKHLLLQILLSLLSTASVTSTPAAGGLLGPVKKPERCLSPPQCSRTSQLRRKKKSTFLSVWLFMLLWKLYSIYIYIKKKQSKLKMLLLLPPEKWEILRVASGGVCINPS